MIRYLLDPNVSRSEPALNCWTLDRKVAVPFRSHDFDKAERPAGQAKAGTGPGAGTRPGALRERDTEGVCQWARRSLPKWALSLLFRSLVFLFGDGPAVPRHSS